MNIHTYWHNDQHEVFRIDISGEWSWDMLESHIDRVQNMILDTFKPETNPQNMPRVDYVIDLIHAGSMPNHSLNRARHFAENQLPNTGLIVVISQNVHTNVVFNTARRLSFCASKYFYMARNLKDALYVIEQLRTEQPASN